MRLVVLGRSNQEIVDELFLAVGTVKTHIHNILVKTEQQNRTTLIPHFWKRSPAKKGQVFLTEFIWANANRRGGVASLRGGFWFMVSFVSICNA